MAIRFYKLSELLRTRKLSKGKLEDMTGISTATTAKLFSKKPDNNVSLGTVDKICNALDCDVSDIMEYEREDKE